jgi:hypothetical protein
LPSDRQLSHRIWIGGTSPPIGTWAGNVINKKSFPIPRSAARSAEFGSDHSLRIAVDRGVGEERTQAISLQDAFLSPRLSLGLCTQSILATKRDPSRARGHAGINEEPCAAAVVYQEGEGSGHERMKKTTLDPRFDPFATPSVNSRYWRNLRVQPRTAFWRIALVRLAPRSEGVRPFETFAGLRTNASMPPGARVRSVVAELPQMAPPGSLVDLQRRFRP